MNRRRTTTVLSANVDTTPTVADWAVLSSLRRFARTPSRDLLGSLAERTGRPAERAWRLAIKNTDGPVALILSRQKLPVIDYYSLL